MKKLVFLSYIILLSSIFSFAQVRLSNEPARPSAEAWQMTRYGDVASSLYTGTMALSVPVYTYKDPDFEIPISLEYSSNGCVPNVRAGVLGPDWSLNAGGVITREIRGFPDEQIYHYTGQFVYHDNPMEIMPYDLTFYGYWWEHSDTTHLYDSGNLAFMSPDNRLLKSPPQTLPLDFSAVTTTLLINPGDFNFVTQVEWYHDLEPDIFHFSVMGYTGSFCLRPDRKTKVFGTNVPSENISVKVDYGLGMTLIITIITSDGYQFKFVDGDCVVRTDSTISNSSPSATTSSWIMDKIIAPNGREAHFYYSDQTQVWNIRPNSFYYNGNVEGVGQTWSSCTSDEGISQTVSTQKHLDSIVIDSLFTIDFSYASHNEIAVNNLEYPVCPRLTSVEMKRGEKVLRTCNLEYSCSSLSPSKVTYLLKVSISGIGDYSFEYFNTLYPRYGTHSVDHWGYYNGKTTGSFLSVSVLDNYNQDEQFIANNRREPDANFAKYGILTKVTYPTGGYSTFEYEANDYSKAVMRKSESNFSPQLYTINSIKVGGGLRIKSVSNYNMNGNLLTRSSYSYRKRDNNSQSSGILLNSPRYKLKYDAQLVNGAHASPLYENVQIASNSLTRLAQRDLEYSEVTETDLDSNSTQYLFTSSENPNIMDTKYYGNVWTDMLEISTDRSSLDKANAISAPSTSFQYLRGRLSASIKYDADGEILKQKENTYSYSPTNSISNLIISPTGLLYQIQDIAVYAGGCNLSSSSEMSLCPSGFIESSHAYEYNNHGQVRSESFVSPDHHDNSKRYYYVTDTLDMQGADTLFFAQMREKNAINRPFRIDKIVDSTIVSSTSISFVQIGGESSHLFRERSIVETDLVNNIVTTTTFQYDTKGHLIEKVVNGTHHTTYIWGYDGLYLVGIVDNCPLSTVRLLAGVSCIADNPIEATISTPDASILRGFGDFTLFDYEPFVGLTRVIEPDGRETVYNYNESGKLSSVNDAGNKKTAGYLSSPDNRLTE